VGCSFRSNTIMVRWSTDDRDTVALIGGYYHAACL
jgi:hypothetical protein